MIIESYHAPSIYSHILTTNLLSQDLEKLFSSSFGPNSCLLFKKGSLLKNDIIFRTPCINGLYPVVHPYYPKKFNNTAKRPTRSDDEDVQEYKTWHEKLGHISADRHQQAADIFDDVPFFDKNTMKKIDCGQCHISQMKKAPVRSVDSNPDFLEENHFEILGPYSPSLGQNIYAAHYLESHTAMSDVFLIKSKSELPSVTMQFISMIENRFSVKNYRVRRLRCDRAGENIPKEIVSFCQEKGILIKPSPPRAPESNGMAGRPVKEHWMRARVLLYSTDLKNALWGEAVRHANWLRNRFPALAFKVA